MVEYHCVRDEYDVTYPYANQAESTIGEPYSILHVSGTVSVRQPVSRMSGKLFCPPKNETYSRGTSHLENDLSSTAPPPLVGLDHLIRRYSDTIQTEIYTSRRKWW